MSRIVKARTSSPTSSRTSNVPGLTGGLRRRRTIVPRRLDRDDNSKLEACYEQTELTLGSHDRGSYSGSVCRSLGICCRPVSARGVVAAARGATIGKSTECRDHPPSASKPVASADRECHAGG